MEYRYHRQSDIVPTDQVREAAVSVVGAGAIGRPLILQLAGIGVGTIEVVDFDKVEDVNLAVQGYRESDLGAYKVDAVASAVRDFTSDCQVTPIRGILDDGSGDLGMYDIDWSEVVPITGVSHPVCFVATDNIHARKMIWESFRAGGRLLIDGRMAGETMQLFTALCNDVDSAKAYEKTLFDPSEAYAERCTARSTLYCGNILAGLMVHQFTRYLRHMPTNKSQQLVLLASELTPEFALEAFAEETDDAVESEGGAK